MSKHFSETGKADAWEPKPRYDHADLIVMEILEDYFSAQYTHEQLVRRGGERIRLMLLRQRINRQEREDQDERQFGWSVT